MTVPSQRSCFTAELKLDDVDMSYVLECKNSTKGSKVVLMKGESIVWSNTYSTCILLTAITKYYFVLSFADATIGVFSLSGRKLFPSLKMDSAASFLKAKDQFLLFVGSLGYLRTWYMSLIQGCDAKQIFVG